MHVVRLLVSSIFCPYIGKKESNEQIYIQRIDVNISNALRRPKVYLIASKLVTED